MRFALKVHGWSTWFYIGHCFVSVCLVASGGGNTHVAIGDGKRIGAIECAFLQIAQAGSMS